jgi:hypothetical protein
MRDGAVRFECEEGFEAKAFDNANAPNGYTVRCMAGGKAILPDICDVLHSLIMDSDAIEYRGFEDWASNFGYDVDSRKAEQAYRACVEVGLKLRNTLGADRLMTLCNAFQDY